MNQVDQEKTSSDPPTVAVVGLGLLGRGIAACFLGHGFRVIGCDRAEASHRNADSYIARGLREMVDNLGINTTLVDTWRSRYHATAGFDDWPPCDFVVESIDENPQKKKDLFDQVESVVGPDVPIGSNTSAIPITQLQKTRRQPWRFFGMHWFEPAYATRFLELIPGEQTTDAIMTTAMSVARRCGKEPSVLTKDIPGFIVNRLGYAIYREALNLLELGIADVETIDRSFRNAIGVWSTLMGPFAWIDLTGGPKLYANTMERVLPTLSTAAELPNSLSRLVDECAQGVVNGHGFYNYSPEEGKRLEELFHAHAWRAHALLDEYSPLKDK